VEMRSRDSTAMTPKARTAAAQMITVRIRMLIAQLVDACRKSYAHLARSAFWHYDQRAFFLLHRD
jgi:hypothetical protein